jgi:hypothetical protein
MPTIVYTEGFEHRVVTNTNKLGGPLGTGIVDTITGSAAFTSVSTGRTGYGMQVSPSGVNAIWSRAATDSLLTLNVVSFYIKFTTLPVADTRVFVFNTATSADARLWFRVSSGTFYINYESTLQNGQDVGSALSTGVWYRVDLRNDVSTTTLKLDCQIDGGTNVQVTYSDVSTGDITYWEWGTDGGTQVWTAIIDDVVASDTSADYPIGAHKVLSVVPESDDTTASTYGTNVMEQGTGTDLSSSNQGWQYLDDWPPTNADAENDADHVTQAVDGATNDVVVNFQNTAETTIWSGEGVVGLKSDAGQFNNGMTRVVYGDASTTTIYNGDMSEVSANYRTGTLLAAKIDTTSEFNGLQGLVGNSGDAAPDPEWLALMIQYAVPEATYAPPFSRPSAIRHLIRR